MGLHGVGDQVHDDLLDLARVGKDQRNIFDPFIDEHGRRDSRPQHLEGLVSDLGEVHPGPCHLLMPAEGENTPNQVAAVTARLHDRFEILALAASFRHPSHQQLRKHENRH